MKQGYEILGSVQRPPRFLVDKSANISFSVGEMSTTQKISLLELEGSVGTLIFVPEDTQTQDLLKIDAQYEGKTPSERLYNTMFVCWKEVVKEGDFDLWRKGQIEKIIQQYKDKLPNNQY